MNLPYNTGKVQIGRAHVPQQLRNFDDDGLRLQRALIAKPDGMDWQDKLVTWACTVVAIALPFIMGWRP